MRSSQSTMMIKLSLAVAAAMLSAVDPGTQMRIADQWLDSPAHDGSI